MAIFQVRNIVPEYEGELDEFLENTSFFATDDQKSGVKQELTDESNSAGQEREDTMISFDSTATYSCDLCNIEVAGLVNLESHIQSHPQLRFSCDQENNRDES